MLDTYQKNLLSHPELTEGERSICSPYLNNFVDEIDEIKEVLDIIKDKKIVTNILTNHLYTKISSMKEFEKKIVQRIKKGGRLIV